jgi:hypothetical protein
MPGDQSSHNRIVSGVFTAKYRTRTGRIGSSRKCYEQAVALDPRFALARNALAEHYFAMTASGFMPSREAIPQVRVGAEAALQIDPHWRSLMRCSASWRQPLNTTGLRRSSSLAWQWSASQWRRMYAGCTGSTL